MNVMADSSNSPITPRRWISNLLEVADDIANRRMQEDRWRAGTWNIWEHPEEPINTVDDHVLNGFIEAFESTFTPDQEIASHQFQDELDGFCSASPQSLNPAEVLDDPQWELVRLRADAFISAFKDRWPEPASKEEADRLLREWMQAYAEKSKK
ncbi:MAG: hypothetical protein WAM66_15310 [Acidobacteriaceae bacterium]